VWANYRPFPDFFEDLDGETQSLIVAAYRTHLQIEAVVTQEQVREARRKARRSKGKGRGKR
jgi:hypothetical protein